MGYFMKQEKNFICPCCKEKVKVLKKFPWRDEKGIHFGMCQECYKLEFNNNDLPF